VTNVLNLIIGAGVAASTSLNNSVTLNGGSLYAANILMTNGFANSFTMTGSAQVTVTNQLLAMTAAALNLTGGTLNMRNSMISNGTALVVGNGADGATLSLLPGGINAFANGLVITNNATLAGSSLIMATSTVYGTLSPGMVVGAITNNGDFILKPDATTVIEMTARSTPGAGWDLLAVTNGTLQLGGNLKVLLTGGFTPSSTDSFVIMTNLGPASVSASFASGGQIPVYTNVDWSRVAGIFKVVIGTQGVALNSFALPIDVGTFFIVY